MLDGPVEAVLPLFGPRREAEWAEGWAPEFTYRETEDADHVGAIFTTEHGQHAIWHVNRFDATAGVIEYLRVASESHVAHITIRCKALPGERTEAEVSYCLTALGPAGEQYLQHLKAHHEYGVAEWEDLINAVLRKG